MKKNMKKFLLVLAMLFIQNNVFADSAYSVGCLFTPASNLAGDTTQLVYDAANAYYQANINSYYNIEPTYSYLNSTTRLGGSRAFFIAGHGTYQAMWLASQGQAGSEYWTGVWNDDYDISSGGFHFVPIDGRNMNNTKVITFAGCNTANLDHSDNLALTAVANGAHAAVGWIGRTDNNRQWLKTYNYALGAGYSVIQAGMRASDAYDNNNTSTYWYHEGNENAKMTTTTVDRMYNPEVRLDTSSERLVTSKINEKEIEYYLATTDPEDIYVTIDTETFEIPYYDNVLFREKLSDYEKSFEKIISIIKNYDSSFNVDDYKLIYKFINKQNGTGFIKFVYYISENISTNKVYTISFNNNKVESIMLTGVRKNNIGNIKSLNEKSLINKVNSFEETKFSTISSEMLSLYEENSNLNQARSNNSLVKTNSNVSEIYHYDYNDNSITYDLQVLQKSVQDSEYIASEQIKLEW